MPITDLFPPQGENIAAMAWQMQRCLCVAMGNGVVSGMTITRNSASSVTVASGIVTSNLAKVNIGEATLSSIPAATSGKHRYDMIIVDLSDNTIKRIVGTEDIPTGRMPIPVNYFLENYTPLPPALSALNKIPLYILRVTENGLEDVTLGSYCTHGIASIRIGGLDATIDFAQHDISSGARGDMLARGASTWLRLTKAARGAILTTGANDPQWFGKGVAGQFLKQAADDPLWANIDHGTDLVGLADNDHPQYILHSIATAINDFIVASGAGVFVKKTVAETRTLLGGSGSGLDADKLDGMEGSGYALRSILTTRGDIPVRDASDWARLAGVEHGSILYEGANLDPTWLVHADTAGKLLQSGGHADNPSWTSKTLATIIAGAPAHYERSRMWKNKGSGAAADRRTIVTPNYLTVNINNLGYILESASELDLNVAGSWDTQAPTDYTVAANRAGKDFYVYACVPGSGTVPVILCSVTSTYPAGYSATTSRKVSSFHCLCVAAGTISSHDLTGYLAGDILPRSVQDLKHRPAPGFMPGVVWAGATDFDTRKGPPIWVGIYLISGTGASTASVYGGTISDTRDWMDFEDDCGAVGCRLPRDPEFQIFAAGSNEETNISGSADPATTGGHSDTAGRRMISHIGCEDCAGAMWQWLEDQSFKPAASISWGWYDLPGAKGSLYNQGGSVGDADVKLLAGGSWADGAACGSRSRAADSVRWAANSHVGCRLVAEPA